MSTLSNPQLSAELQGFYLMNKQWLSDVIFLEDEIRFYKKVFDRFFSSSVMDDKFNHAQPLNILLLELEERRKHLKTRLIRHQKIVEFMLEVDKAEIGADTLDENVSLVNEIEELFNSNQHLKKELFTMVDQIIKEEKEGHLLGSEL